MLFQRGENRPQAFFAIKTSGDVFAFLQDDKMAKIFPHGAPNQNLGGPAVERTMPWTLPFGYPLSAASMVISIGDLFVGENDTPWVIGTRLWNLHPGSAKLEATFRISLSKLRAFGHHSGDFLHSLQVPLHR